MAVGYRSASNTGDAVDGSATRNIAVPAGAAAGDVVLAFITYWNGGGAIPTITPPSGFVQAGTWTSGDGGAKNYAYYKRLTAADAGNYTFTFNASAWITIQCVCFTGVASVGNPVKGTPTTTAGTFGTYTTISQTVAVGDVVVWSGYNDTGATHTPPTGFVEVADVDCASTAYQIAAADGTLSAANASVASSSPAGAILLTLDAAGPLLVSTGIFGSDWSTTAASKTASPAVVAGDLLVVAAISANAPTTLGTPTGGTGLSWTLQRSNTTSDCGMWVWTVPVTTSETPTLSVARTAGGDPWGARWWLFRNHGGVGASAIDTSGTDDAVLAITTTAADSTVIAAIGDWSAVNEAGTWSGITGATETDNDFVFVNGAYTVHNRTFEGVGAAETKTVTLATPTAMTPTIALLEVLASGSPAIQDTLSWQVEVVRS